MSGTQSSIASTGRSPSTALRSRGERRSRCRPPEPGWDSCSASSSAWRATCPLRPRAGSCWVHCSDGSGAGRATRSADGQRCRQWDLGLHHRRRRAGRSQRRARARPRAPTRPSARQCPAAQLRRRRSRRQTLTARDMRGRVIGIRGSRCDDRVRTDSLRMISSPRGPIRLPGAASLERLEYGGLISDVLECPCCGEGDTQVDVRKLARGAANDGHLVRLQGTPKAGVGPALVTASFVSSRQRRRGPDARDVLRSRQRRLARCSRFARRRTS